MRLVLYVSPEAHGVLAAEAGRRGQASGLEVTPEATARAILYAGLGLGPGGKGSRPRGTSHMATLAQELMDMIQALTDRLTDDEAPLPEPHAIVTELDRMYLRLKKEASDGHGE